MMQSLASYGPVITRVGLAGVLVWFGAQQLLHAADWTGYVPEFVPAFLGVGAQSLVLANGAVEIASGAMLLLGLYTRMVAFVMGIHLVLIALSLGGSAVAVRDWGLAFAFFGLVLTGPGPFSLDRSDT